MLQSVTARTKRDHWVLGLPRDRWYTVHSQLTLSGSIETLMHGDSTGWKFDFGVDIINHIQQK